MAAKKKAAWEPFGNPPKARMIDPKTLDQDSVPDQRKPPIKVSWGEVKRRWDPKKDDFDEARDSLIKPTATTKKRRRS